VNVELRQPEAELELIIRDDGVGFDSRAAVDGATSGSSFGLMGMRERVQLVGGRIEIRSEPQRGTEIRARFPIRKA
jgi:signal transduction histidine kinase